MYKCAMLGCGGRAKGHAEAYRYVTRGKLAAVCDSNTERLYPFGEKFAIPKDKCYTDLNQMLEKEKPDVLHIVTPPSLRLSLMSIAAEHRVPAAIVEKPIAIQGEDWRNLLAFSKNTKTKFVVNTQLHFHPRNLDLKASVLAGKIGEIKFIDASARSTVLNQGPHVLQLVSSYINNSRPKKVFSQIAVGRLLNSGEPAPDHAEASVLYENGVRAMLNFGTEAAPMSNENPSVYMHKRVAVFGSKGYVHWHMFGWERFTREGGYESGHHTYNEEDIHGQAGLTEAVFDWLADEKKEHPTHLGQSLAEFNLLMAIYSSALAHKPIDLPYDPPDGLIESLKRLG